MPGGNILANRLRRIVKTITFDGVTFGAIGSDTLFTVTGRVLVTHLSAFCSTSLTIAANGELELGVAGNTAALIAQIADAGDLVATEFWNDASPTDVLVADAITDKLVASDILLKTTTGAISAGVIEFAMYWLPLSVDGNVA